MSNLQCERCGGAAIATVKRSTFTVLGLIGASVFLVGGFGACVGAGPLAGLLVALAGIGISVAGARNLDVVKCTACGYSRRF